MSPVCVNCAVNMKCVKNGVSFVERDYESNQPIYISNGDMGGCPLCGQKILSGFGERMFVDEERRKEIYDVDPRVEVIFSKKL